MEKGTPYKDQFPDKADRAKLDEREGNDAPHPSWLPPTPPAFKDSVEARAFLDKRTIEEEARGIVEGARQEEYGGPEDSFTAIARLWTAHLANRGHDVYISPGDVALMMDLMKTARLITAPGHRDSLVDKIGYTIAYAKTVGVEE